MAALLVNYGTLLVHHIIVLEQALTDTEIIFLDLLLCLLDRACNHGVLNHLALLETETVHNLCNTVTGEEAHELVLE